MNSKPFVSVIIPVFNDPVRLRKCLEALQKQSYPKKFYEVIVVDNGSKESLKPIIAQFSQARVIFEGHPGSYTARNKGITVAKGEILAFTDSDCIPAIDWIEKGVRNLLTKTYSGIIGGKIEIFFKNPKKPTAIERFDALLSFDQKECIQKEHFSVTANLFVHKRIFDTIGYFDHELKSSADYDWGQRAYSHGYRTIYCEDVVIAHPTRNNIRQLCKKEARIVGGLIDLKQKNRITDHRINKFFSLKATINTIMKILNQENISLIQKIKVLLVGVAVKYMKTRERIRLLLGGISQR